MIRTTLRYTIIGDILRASTEGGGYSDRVRSLNFVFKPVHRSGVEVWKAQSRTVIVLHKRCLIRFRGTETSTTSKTGLNPREKKNDLLG